jgi:lantibiotic modifying enzyme
MHALQTTADAVDDAVRRGTANFSLCHGLAGNADVLLSGAEALPSLAPRARRLAEAVGVAGIERYARDHDWPCGAGGGETPGLMLGLAGIGHFFLRLHSPDIPSVLVWRREQIVTRARTS